MTDVMLLKIMLTHFWSFNADANCTYTCNKSPNNPMVYRQIMYPCCNPMSSDRRI